MYLCSKYAVWNTALDFFFFLKSSVPGEHEESMCTWARLLNTYWCSGLLQGLLSEAGYVVDDGREVGGTVELNLRQTHPVRFHHTFDSCAHIDNNPFTSLSDSLSIFTLQQCFEQTCAKWLRWVEIERKLMGNLLSQTISSSCHTHLAQLQHQIPTPCKQRHECICNFSFHLIRRRDLGSEAKGRKHLVTKQEGETI